MTAGRFYEKSIPEVRQWLSSLDETSYRVEAHKLIERFFVRYSGIDAHLEMLQATYVQQHADAFWDLYWTLFKNMLLDVRRVQKLIELLAFWFDGSPQILADLPYLAQGFFIQLPAMLQQTKESKESAKAFQRVAPLINQLAAKWPWYSLIDHFFVDKKRKVLGLF